MEELQVNRWQIPAVWEMEEQLEQNLALLCLLEPKVDHQQTVENQKTILRWILSKIIQTPSTVKQTKYKSLENKLS